MANGISGIGILLIGGILPPANALCRQIISDFPSFHLQKRPHDLTAHRQHPPQTAQTAAPAEMKEHGFCLILPVMRYRDPASFSGLDFYGLTLFFQALIAKDPGSFLRAAAMLGCIGLHRHRDGMAGYIPLVTEFHDKALILQGLRSPQAMLYMHGIQMAAHFLLQFFQCPQKADGICAAGYRCQKVFTGIDHMKFDQGCSGFFCQCCFHV